MIDRASPNDMMQMATEAEVPIQVGAVLVLEPAAGVDADVVRDTLAQRIEAVPRLRQRLLRTPFGCGRPIWVDDPTFEVGRHVDQRECPPPGDETALLAVATDIVGIRLPDDRPLWAASIVTGLRDGRTGMVIVFNHVLADGIGGLAVLANLVDGTPAPTGYGFPRPAPTSLSVARDAWSSRLRTLTRWRDAGPKVRDALAELKPGVASHAPRTSLNRPTGSRRATAVVHADLAAVVAAAHGVGGTVNDVVLAAVGGALHELAAGRGEHVDHLVFSIPISARREAGVGELGNEVGVLPVELPVAAESNERLRAVARITRERKAAAGTRGSSAVVVGPLFRLLAALGLVQPFMNRQHLINTLVTNLRGPDQRLSFGGATVGQVIPISIVTGNVTVAFAVLSYAATLTITINSDADACPDLDVLVGALEAELSTLVGTQG